MKFEYVLVLVWLLDKVGACPCENNGKCVENRCQCISGYYGTSCQNYASAYQIEYKSTPKDLEAFSLKLMHRLEGYGMVVVLSRDPGNTFKLVFHNNTSQDLSQIKTLLTFAANSPERLGDFDECLDGQVCDYNRQCVNTPGSFVCSCQTDFLLKDNKCVKSKNTALAMYIWVGTVGCLVIFMIIFVVFIRWRKNKAREKEERFQAQYERQARSESTLNATRSTLNSLQVPRTAFPGDSRPPSIFGGDSRPLSIFGGPSLQHMHPRYAGSLPELYQQRHNLNDLSAV